MKNPEGKPVDVELGGLMWVKTVDMPWESEVVRCILVKAF